MAYDLPTSLPTSWLLRYIVIIVAVASNDTLDFNHQPNHCWCYCSILVCYIRILSIWDLNIVFRDLNSNLLGNDVTDKPNIVGYLVITPRLIGRPGPPASFPCTGDRLWPRSSTLGKKSDPGCGASRSVGEIR